MYAYPAFAILVFAKLPVVGRVKTRLFSTLGPLDAARLHARTILWTLQLATTSRLAPVELWVDAAPSEPFLELCTRRFSLTLRRQIGDSLGDRMAFAFRRLILRGRPAILIGSDVAGLTARVMGEAMAELSRGARAVIAPTEDGGYGLIGLSRTNYRVFDCIPWGTDQVYRETQQRLQRLGWDWRELDRLWDLDRPEDVVRLSREGVELPPLPSRFRLVW